MEDKDKYKDKFIIMRNTHHGSMPVTGYYDSREAAEEELKMYKKMPYIGHSHYIKEGYAFG